MRHHSLMPVLVLPLVVAATARGDIYLKIFGIQGNSVAGCNSCIAVQSLQLGGQVMSAASPWTISPPAGVHSVTLTKAPDGASAALSLAAAGPNTSYLGSVEIVVLSRDATGATKSGTTYILSSASMHSFKSTGSLETIVLDFSKIALGNQSAPPVASGPPTLTPIPTPVPPEVLRKIKRPV